MMTITVNDDFDLYKIVNSGQCFRPAAIGANTYHFITGENILIIRELPASEVHANEISAFEPLSSERSEETAVSNTCHTFSVSCSENDWKSIWAPYFDLDLNYSSIRESVPKKDKYMTHCAEVGAGIRMLRQDKWEMLISFIISQRKSIPAIRSSVEKLCERYGHEIPVPEISEAPVPALGCPLHSFPTPKELSRATKDELKECGLGYRVPYIYEVTKQVNEGKIDLITLDTLNDDDLFTELKKIKGVGDKVANCVELFGYHRLGRAPVDTWIAKVINEQYGGINPFPAYKEKAGVLQQYVFYTAQHARE